MPEYVPRPRRPKGTTGKPGLAIGYPFDPIPKIAVDMADQGRLKEIDIRVLAHLLRYRIRLINSCWTTIPRLAREVGRCARTVQRSLRRLEAAGLILHVRIEDQDPDEPRNKTGWRFVFVWMDGAPLPTSVSPPRCQPCHPPGDTRVTQSKNEGNPILPLEGRKLIKPTTTADAAGSSSHSLISSLEESKTPEPITPPTAEPAPEWDDAIRAAGGFWSQPARVIQDVRLDCPDLTPEIVVRACLETSAKEKAGKIKKSPHGHAMSTMRRMAAERPRVPTPVDNSHRYIRAKDEYTHPKDRTPEQNARIAAKAAAEAKAIADTKAELDAMPPEERSTEARRLLDAYRDHGRDFEWDGTVGGFRPVLLASGIAQGRARAASFRAIDERMQLFRPEIRAILDAERASPDYVDPLERQRQAQEAERERKRLKAEADEKAKRPKEAMSLIEQAETHFFAVVDADGLIDLVDSIPIAPTPEQEHRFFLSNLTRKSLGPRLVVQLRKLESEVREILKARSGAKP